MALVKRWYPTTTLHGVRNQKTSTFKRLSASQGVGGNPIVSINTVLRVICRPSECGNQSPEDSSRANSLTVGCVKYSPDSGH